MKSPCHASHDHVALKFDMLLGSITVSVKAPVKYQSNQTSLNTYLPVSHFLPPKGKRGTMELSPSVCPSICPFVWPKHCECWNLTVTWGIHSKSSLLELSWPIDVQRQDNLPMWPHGHAHRRNNHSWNLVDTRTQQPLGWIHSKSSSLGPSSPVDVQSHGHLPLRCTRACPYA